MARNGASDVYRPYIRPHAHDAPYVQVARGASILIMLLGGLVALRLGRVTTALDLLVSIGAGTGLVLILRGYWWRVSAWSERAAVISATVDGAITTPSSCCPSSGR